MKHLCIAREMQDHRIVYTPDAFRENGEFQQYFV